MRGEEHREPAFLVDSMHGKLCRWLRILGFDAKYWVGDDEGLASTAVNEGRIVLTSDVEAYRMVVARGVEAILIAEREIPEMLARIASHVAIKHGVEISDFLRPKGRRCSTCNALLRAIGSDTWVCEGCGKRFWVGSHWKGITSSLKSAYKYAEKLIDERGACKDRGIGL